MRAWIADDRWHLPADHHPALPCRHDRAVSGLLPDPQAAGPGDQSEPAAQSEHPAAGAATEPTKVAAEPHDKQSSVMQSISQTRRSSGGFLLFRRSCVPVRPLTDVENMLPLDWTMV